MSKIGWGEKEEGVAKIIIDDKAQFAKDTWFPEEAEVRIYYYVRVQDIYFIGEILDIDGFCGGFNLQNAWSTAFVAAEAISSY